MVVEVFDNADEIHGDVTGRAVFHVSGNANPLRITTQ
jgi:hypothetical protein